MSNKQKYTLALIVTLVLVGASIYTFAVHPIGLGLDLKGGLNVVLTAVDQPRAPVTKKAMDKAIFVVRQRVDKLGVAEPSIEKQGSHNIVVQLPGIKNPSRALEIIGQTALLEFALVKPEFQNLTDEQLNDEQRKGKEVVENTLLSGKDLTKARATFGGGGGQQIQNEPVVEMSFNSKGAAKFADITSKNVGKRLAILLDKEVMSAPNIREPIRGGSAEISGLDSLNEAKRIALVLQTGRLPVKLEIAESQAVGPTLGQESLIAGLRAGIIGLILVALYMAVYYRALGFVTWLILGVFGSLLTGGLVALDAILASVGSAGVSFSLPSIAGVILMIGVAADSSIIIFERVREEVRAGKSLRAAMDVGFSQGFHTFLDADLVTFTTAAVLFYFGIGPVKGFALILMLGIACDLITSLLFTRSILGLFATYNLIKNPSLIGLKPKMKEEG